MDHFQKPRNQGAIKSPDGTGQAGNPLCGDIMKIYIKTKKAEEGRIGPNKAKKARSQNDVIKDIKFETLGCGAAIANSSILTTMVKGKTIKEALNINRDDIAKALGGVPAPKLHCSMLATEAFQKAVEDYLK